MKLVAKFVLILIASVQILFAQVPGYTDFPKPGEYAIRLRASDANPVICNITIVDYSAQMQHKGWWGIESEVPTPADTPQTIIKMITFVVNGEEFIAPLSSYADLADPDRAMVQKTAGHYRLLMDGSDAAGGYRVTIDFDDWHVIERTVHGAEFPNYSWEETTYHIDTTAVGH